MSWPIARGNLYNNNKKKKKKKRTVLTIHSTLLLSFPCFNLQLGRQLSESTEDPAEIDSFPVSAILSVAVQRFNAVLTADQGDL